MRRPFAALLLAASCSAMAARQVEVREAFERWRDAVASGDAEETVRGLSAGFKSDWMFRLLSGGDPQATDWRVRLEGPARTDLDLWLEHQKKHYAGRAATLPATVLAHPSLDRFLVEYFGRAREELKFQFADLVVANVYVDETGATVEVRNRLRGSEWYNMVVEAGLWKVDGHFVGIRPLPR